MSVVSKYPTVPKSITNSNVSDRDVIDKDSPMSYGVFLTVIQSYYGDDIQDFYSEYVKRWNTVKLGDTERSENEILERYKNFVRELTLKFDTIEEKQFFQNIDFDDKGQLAISIPFFKEKIKDIANYYKKKREDVKSQTIKNKSLGISVDLKNRIKDFTVNFVESIPDAFAKYDINQIKEDLSVEIEELFDSYPLYYDQTPDQTVYDFKDLDYGLDIFLRADDELIEEVFSDVSDEIRSLKEVASLFNLKRKETTRNIATDFYYLSTGNSVTQYLSGKLFDNNSDIKNFFNRNHPTTASTPKGFLQTERDRGYFRPQKSGIVLLDGERKEFRFDTSKLKPNSLYYFPDPLLSNVETFIEVVIDDKGLSKNKTSGSAKNEPKIGKNDTTIHGYVSERYLDGENRYFQEIYDRGYIKDLKRDIFGNIYCLISDDDDFKINLKVENQNVVKSLVLNGHKFYDNIYGEGFSFDYGVEDYNIVKDTVRSGLSANTGDFSDSSGSYTLFGRYFSPYEEPKEKKTDQITYVYYDGGFISNVDDPISSDLDAFPGSSLLYYYDTLLECGIHTVSPLVRPLNDPLFPTLTANLLEDFIPDDTQTFDIDCGNIIQNFEYDYTFNSPQYHYNGDVVCQSILQPISSFNVRNYIRRKNLSGKILVKNVSTGEVTSLSGGLSYLQGILPENVITSLESGVIRFEVVGDILSLESDEYLVFVKIGFDGEKFSDPKSSAIIHQINKNPFNRVSGRYLVGKDIHFNIFDTDNYPLSSKQLDLNLWIGKVDTKTLSQEIIGTTMIPISSGDIIYHKMDFPVVCHNQTRNMFNVSVLLKDQNHLFDILDINFKDKPFKITETNLHKNSSVSFSNISADTVSILSSANISTGQNYLLVI
jgi:hypothetical protein